MVVTVSKTSREILWTADISNVNLGHLSNIPGLNFYHFITSETGPKVDVCYKYVPIEGTIMPRFHSSMWLVTCLVAVYIYLWTMDSSIE
jgi:hypothetical protein